MDPQHDVADMPTERMGPPPGALPPMRMTASWLGPEVDLPNTSLWRQKMPEWRAPLGSSNRQAPSDAEAMQKPLSQFIIAPRAQASRRCETQASLSGKPLSFG